MAECTHQYESEHRVRYEFDCPKCGKRKTQYGTSRPPDRKGCTDSGAGPYDPNANEHNWGQGTKYPEVKYKCTKCGDTKDWQSE